MDFGSAIAFNEVVLEKGVNKLYVDDIQDVILGADQKSFVPSDKLLNDKQVEVAEQITPAGEK